MVLLQVVVAAWNCGGTGCCACGTGGTGGGGGFGSGGNGVEDNAGGIKGAGGGAILFHTGIVVQYLTVEWACLKETIFLLQVGFDQKIKSSRF